MVGADGAHEAPTATRAAASRAPRHRRDAPFPAPLPSTTCARPLATTTADPSPRPAKVMRRRHQASTPARSAKEAAHRHAFAAIQLHECHPACSDSLVETTHADKASGRRKASLRRRCERERERNRSLQALPTAWVMSGTIRRGRRDQSRQQAPGLTLHNAKSMDDLLTDLRMAATHAPAMIPQAEVRAQAGRTATGGILLRRSMRPSTAAPADQARAMEGHGHRQYSSDALGTSQGPVDPASLEPRMFSAIAVHRRRSQAASSSPKPRSDADGQYSADQVASDAAQLFLREGPVDSRYARPAGMEDPRYAGMPTHPAQSLQPRPTSPAARPPQFNAPSTYGGPNSYSVQSFGQASDPWLGLCQRIWRRAPNAAPNFNTFHGHDPRLGANGMQGSLTPARTRTTRRRRRITHRIDRSVRSLRLRRTAHARIRSRHATFRLRARGRCPSSRCRQVAWSRA